MANIKLTENNLKVIQAMIDVLTHYRDVEFTLLNSEWIGFEIPNVCFLRGKLNPTKTKSIRNVIHKQNDLKVILNTVDNLEIMSYNEKLYKALNLKWEYENDANS